MYQVIPDERPLIEQTLRELCDDEGCSLVVTTGGTGPAPRDVTPEATEAVRPRQGRPATSPPAWQGTTVVLWLYGYISHSPASIYNAGV